MKIIDTHCDTLTEIFNKKEKLYKNNLHISIEQMKTYQGYAQFFACFLAPEFKEHAREYACSAFNNFFLEIKENDEEIEIAKSYDEYINILSKGKIASFLSIEGGEVIEKIEDVEFFYNLGVRMMALTWNYDNKIASGVLGDERRGVTEYGRQVLDEMNRLNILCDVSHLNEKSFWDIAEYSKKTFEASHSNAYSVCNNKRNLKDEQIKEIIRRKGFVGINLYPYFLTDTNTAKISDVLKMIEYFLSIGGEDIIGLGCDFDGVDVLPYNISGICDLEKIFEEMAKIGYSKELIDKIAHKNCENMLKLF